MGTTIEWYDFFVYGTSVVLVLGPLFFPANDALTSTLLAFSTIGVGFLARPLGAAVLSHLGDRVGRRQALVASLLLMGGATIGVGLLPTYQHIGLWAPALLVFMRCIQGFAVGGEWGGAVLLAYEHAPEARQGFYASFPQFGTPLGLMSSSLAILLAQNMSRDAFEAWGWRLPFLGSVVLVAVGLWIRLRVTDAEEFLEVRRAGRTLRRPIRQLFCHHWKVVLLGTAATSVCHAAYIVTSFLPAYATTTLGASAGAALVALVVGSALSMGVLAVIARRADSVDKRWFAVAGGLLATAWAFPAFLLAEELETLGLVVGIGGGLVFGAVQYAVIPALLAERFPVNIRYSGVSACFQLSALLGGALLPVGASWAVGTAGGRYWPAASLMAAAGLVTALGAAFLPRTDEQTRRVAPRGIAERHTPARRARGSVTPQA